MLDHTPPDGGRIVSPSPDSEEPSTEEQVQLLHAALRQCLGLLHCVILKEEEEWGELQGDYETMRKNVGLRLEHLLYSTKDLVETEGKTLDVTPDHQCNEVKSLIRKHYLVLNGNKIQYVHVLVTLTQNQKERKHNLCQV